MRLQPVVLIAALAAAIPALAQQQKVTGPVAQYWVSAETAAGMNMGAMGGGLGGMMGRMMGGGGDGGKRLVLQLGSAQGAPADPRAQHDIPPGMAMGASLPLVTPKAERPVREPGDLPQGMEKPRGRMLIFWGCGERARPGQPVVIDFAKVAQGQMPAGLAARRVNVPNPPAFGRNRSYGDWPNPEDSRPVPANASLRGDHVVKGNYSPEIRFGVDRHDFMDPVTLASQAMPSGAAGVRWNAVGGATGYFAMVTGGNDREEVVFWSSAEVQEMGGALMDYVPPAEVARLIREKVVLAPSVTECAVPAEVVKAAPAAFLSFIAYGDELNVVHPPRPQDATRTWEQVYAVKVRLKSTGSMLLSEGGMAGGTGSPRARQQPDAAPPAGETAAPQAPANPVEQGIGILRGILGR
jgi:hypothetical protein